MMGLRGRFIRGDGLVIPNTISIAGAQMILAGALRDTPMTLWAGLVQGAPSPDMTLATLSEPTVANGYARIPIDRSIAGWPVMDTIGAESYIESDWLTWTPTAPFDVAIQRVALFGTDARDSTNPCFCLSSPLPDQIILDPTTPLGNRQFKYQIFL